MSDCAITGCDFLIHPALMLAIINNKKEQIDYF